jgi:hypothetical protein
MSAIHKLKLPIIEGLDTEADSIYRRAAQLSDILIGNIIGISLNGNLLNAITIPNLGSVVNKRLQLRRWQKRRRTSAKIYSLQAFVRYKTCLFIHLGVHSHNHLIHMA